MTRQVAFVRNIMIGREGLHRQVLLDIFSRHGAGYPVSYISTGNVAFDFDHQALDDFVDGVEESIERVIGRRESLFVRTLDWLTDFAVDNPFDRHPWASESADRLVTFARHPIAIDDPLPITNARGEFEIFEVGDREVFSICRLVDGRTKSPGGLIEELVGEKVTTRAWSTIERIVVKESSR